MSSFVCEIVVTPMSVFLKRGCACGLFFYPIKSATTFSGIERYIKDILFN